MGGLLGLAWLGSTVSASLKSNVAGPATGVPRVSTDVQSIVLGGVEVSSTGVQAQVTGVVSNVPSALREILLPVMGLPSAS